MKCFVIVVQFSRSIFAALADSLYIIPLTSAFVKGFFKVFSKTFFKLLSDGELVYYSIPDIVLSIPFSEKI